MARTKTKIKSYDFSSNQPEWAAKLRQQYLQEQDALANADSAATEKTVAIANDYQARGEPLSDEELQDLHAAMASGAQDWVRPKDRPADFSNVDSAVNTKPIVPKSYMERANEGLAQQVDELKTIGTGVLGSLESKAAGAGALAADYAGTVFPLLPESMQETASRTGQDAADVLTRRSAKHMEAFRTGAEDLKTRYPAWLVDTVGDVTQSPESALSIVGGPLAALPASAVFLQEYGQSRAADLTPKESATNAGIQGGVELAFSAIPSRKLLKNLPVVGPAVKKLEGSLVDSLESRLGQAAYTAARATQTAVGEGLEEGATGIVQDAARRLQGLVGSEKAKEYAATQVIAEDEYWQNIWRQTRAGMAMGGPIGGLEASITGAKVGAAQRKDREQKLTTSIDTARGNELLQQDQAAAKQDTILNQDIALELQRKQDAEDKQAAFDQAEKDAAKQKELEEEAGFQTIKRDEGLPTSRVERYADVVERVPVNPPAEVTAENVASQRDAEQRAEAERVERAKKGQLAETLKKRRAAMLKSQLAKDVRAEKLATNEEAKRRRVIADQLLAENPNASEAELVSAFEERLADPTQGVEAPATKTPPTLEERIDAVRKKLESAQKYKASRMQTERIKAVVRRNPDVPTEQLAEQLRQEGIAQPEGTPLPSTAVETKIPAPKKTDSTLADKEINDLVEGLVGNSLGMASNKGRRNYEQELDDTVKALDAAKPSMDNLEAWREWNDTRDAVLKARRQPLLEMLKGDYEHLDSGVPARTAYAEKSLARQVPKADALVDGVIGRAAKITSLGMAASKADLKAAGKARRGEEVPTETAPTEDRAVRDARFREKGKAFVKSLAARTRQDSRDMQTLLHQGKIVVGLNASDLGREEMGRGAEYDPATGKMYVYLDGIDTNDAVGSIAAALHESNHALMTPEQINLANGKIRAAAKKGNKLAQAAVRQAEADTDARTGDDTFENEEVVAYFASEAKKNEGKALGTVGAVVRDLTSAARSGIRKHLGVDLDVSIGEVATALSGALGDASRTTIKPRTSDTITRGMIYNQNSKGFDEAVRKGYIYESVDGRKKYVLSDADAKLKDGAKVRLRDTTKSSTLGDIMDHSVLYKEEPAAANIPVYVVDEIPGNPAAFALYDSNDQSIWVTKKAVNNTDPNKTSLKEALMHEVQHYVQDQGGYLVEQAYLENPSLTNIKDNFVKLNKTLDQASRKMLDEVPRAARPLLDKSGQNELTDLVFDTEPADSTKAAQISALLAEQEVELDGDAGKALADYRAARVARNEAMMEYQSAADTAYADYLSNILEREAFRTQKDTDLSEEEVRTRGNPEPQMREQDNATSPRSAGRIDVAETPYAERFQEAAGRSTLGQGGLEKPTKLAPVSLGMAAVQSPEAKAVRRSSAVVNALPELWNIQGKGESARKIFTGLTSNSKFLGHDLLAAFEHAKSSPAGEEARANQSLGKYDKALHALALERGVDPEALNNQIMEELDSIDNQSDSYSANLAAYKAITDKYGAAGQHLMALRNQVDDLTKTMLRLRAQSSSKPSADEAKVIKTMAANLGRYSHRLYAAHQGKAGKTYAKAVQSAYMKGKAGKKLTPKQQETFEMMRRAATTLIDNSLMIPDDAAIAEMGGNQLIRLYKTWGTENAKALSLDQMRDELADMRQKINGDTTRLQNTADDILKQILGLKNTDQPIATYFRGSKQNRGILQERAHIPAEIRAVMGEITDPGTRLLAAVAKQAEFVARTKFLLEVQNFARPEDLQPPGSTGTDTVLENKMTELKGEGFGPLEGWFVSPNLRAMLDDVRESIANFEEAAFMAGQQPQRATTALLTAALNKWAMVAGVSKRLQIVGNLFLMPLNFGGALFMPLANGNINPATYVRGLQDAIRLIAYETVPSLGLGSASDPVTYGVTDSATVGELKGLPYEKIKKLATLMAGKKPSALFKFAKQVGLTLQQTYAMADVWAKIANYHNEVNNLTRYYKLNNQTRTEEQIKREAADITNRTNITYKRAMPLFKAMERQGLTAFGPYFYEVFRSQIGNALQGLGEIASSAKADTPAAAAQKLWRGSTRLSGQATYWSLAAGLTSALASIMFGDDDDEWDKRSLFPEYLQNQDFYPVGLDKNGKPIYFAVSRIDAIGPITDIMRQAMSGGLNFDQAKEELLNLYVRPRLVPQMWTAGQTIFSDTGKPRDPLTQQWSAEGYSRVLKAGEAVGLEDKITKALTNLVEAALMPGTLNATKSTNPVIAKAGPAGEAMAQAAMAAKVIGATFVKPDPAKSLSFAKMDYDDQLKSARAQMFDMFRDHPNISDDEIIEKINEVSEDQHKYWNEVARVYRGMNATGMGKKEIEEALKESKISGELLKQVKHNKFEPTVVSKDSFTQLAANSMRDMDKEEKKEAKKKWDAAWKRLNNIQEGSN